MKSPRRVPFFDGHNDVLLRLYRRGCTDAPRAFLEGEGKGHSDLPMAREGGFAGGLFAIFVPSANGAMRPRWLQRPRQLVRTGVLYRKASSSICLTRKSATSARETNPHVQWRASASAR